MTVGRGITMDTEGRMWAAVGGDEQSHVACWHVDDCRGGQSVAVPQDQLIALPAGLRGPTAVGSDAQGHIWVMHYLSRFIAKIHPDDNMRVETYEGTNQVYSFSDFNGMLGRMAAGQGTYYHDIQAECDILNGQLLIGRQRLLRAELWHLPRRRLHEGISSPKHRLFD